MLLLGTHLELGGEYLKLSTKDVEKHRGKDVM